MERVKARYREHNDATTMLMCEALRYRPTGSIRQVAVYVQRWDDGRSSLTDRLFTTRPMMIKCIVSSCINV